MARKSWQPNPRARRQRPKGRPGVPRTRFRPSGHAPDGPALLYGWHTVKAALENPARRIRRLLATENALRRLADDGVSLPVKPELVRPDVIDARLGPDAVHQGLLAEADPLPAPSISELASEGIVLVLDQITDPHNVGAILRSAAAFAVKAIITTARHSPEATGVLAKSASGALELVPLVTVQNLARGMEELRQRGLPACRTRQWWRNRSRRPRTASAAGSGFRRRRKRSAPADESNLRSPCAHRPARRDQKPERVERGDAGTLRGEPPNARHLTERQPAFATEPAAPLAPPGESCGANTDEIDQ